MALRFIFHYPEVAGPDGDLLDAGDLRDVAVAVERVGFDALSLSEHPIPGARWLESGGHQTLDPFVALGYVAAATDRLRLLTYLSVATYRNPFLLAKSAATLDKLSGGRVTLGLGVGYSSANSTRLVSISRSATCCSTRRWTFCRCTGAVNRSATRGGISAPTR